jgi:Xaa-Pro aminopeptidase
VILFCRERDAERERWDGPRAGTEGAVDTFGMDDAFPIDDIDDILPGLIEGRERVYYHFGRDVDFDLRLIAWVNRVRAQMRQGARPPHEFVALSHLLHDLRLYKSRGELRLMKKSAQIAAAAHVRAMQATQPGMNEHEIEAELLHVFRKHGAVPSYEPIVGGGANGCVLHYRANNAPLRDGDLLLIDAGAEFECYASDITRTFPVNGRYSPEQRALYDIVLDAQRAAIDEVRAGRPFDAYHDAAVRVITRGLIKLGLLSGSLERTCANTRIAPSTCTRPATGSASTCTTRATIASTANTVCSNRAWSSPSNPVCTSRPTRKACRRSTAASASALRTMSSSPMASRSSSPTACRRTPTKSRH